MKNIYDAILADGIIRIKKQNYTDWRRVFMFCMTVINMFNWWIITSWLNFFDILDYPELKPVDWFGDITYINRGLNLMPSMLLIFGLPAFVFNYITIFAGKRYIKLIKQYSKITAHYYLIFIFISLFANALSMIVIGNLR
jgi:hypothetical protein